MSQVQYTTSTTDIKVISKRGSEGGKSCIGGGLDERPVRHTARYSATIKKRMPLHICQWPSRMDHGVCYLPTEWSGRGGKDNPRHIWTHLRIFLASLPCRVSHRWRWRQMSDLVPGHSEGAASWPWTFTKVVQQYDRHQERRYETENKEVYKTSNERILVSPWHLDNRRRCPGDRLSQLVIPIMGQ